MPKIKFDTVMLDTNDEAISEKDTGAVLTLGRIALIALDTLLDTDKGEVLESKLERGALADKVAKALREAKTITLSTKEIMFLKNRISQVFASSHLVFKACEILSK